MKLFTWKWRENVLHQLLTAEFCKERNDRNFFEIPTTLFFAEFPRFFKEVQPVLFKFFLGIYRQINWLDSSHFYKWISHYFFFLLPSYLTFYNIVYTSKWNFLQTCRVFSSQNGAGGVGEIHSAAVTQIIELRNLKIELSLKRCVKSVYQEFRCVKSVYQEF